MTVEEGDIDRACSMAQPGTETCTEGRRIIREGDGLGIPESNIGRDLGARVSEVSHSCTTRQVV